jgi:hypothetical protein
MSGRWLICEKTGSWAAALRWASDVGAPRLHETRSLVDCREELQRWPASFLVLEATSTGAESVVRLVDELKRSFSRSSAVVVAERQLAPWEGLLREAGAIEVVFSPRRLHLIAGLAARHLARIPRPRQSLRRAIWSRLPWSPE